MLMQQLIFSLFLCLIKGGFSMGGAMALHLACRYHPDVAGVFALSSFLNKDSVTYQVNQHWDMKDWIVTCKYI